MWKRGRSFSRAEGGVSSQEGRSFSRAEGAVSSQEGRSFSRVEGGVSSQEGVVLSCQGEAASCLGGACPLELLDLEASPSGGPWGAACREGGPSYLEGGLLVPLGAELLVQVGTGWGPRRCWRLLLLLQLFLFPGGSSPAGKGRPPL